MVAKICHVCKKACEGAHSCKVCGNIIHAVCGEPIGEEGEERDRSPIRCNVCLELETSADDVRNIEENIAASSSDKSAKGVYSIFLHKQKRNIALPPSTSAKRRRKDQKNEHYCLVCKKTLNRGNNYSRKRHAASIHKNESSYNFRKHIVPIDQVSARERKAARQKDGPHILPKMCKRGGGKHSEDIIEDSSVTEECESSAETSGNYRTHIVPNDHELSVRERKAARQKDAPHILEIPEMCNAASSSDKRAKEACGIFSQKLKKDTTLRSSTPAERRRKDQKNEHYCLVCEKTLSRGNNHSRKRHADNIHKNHPSYNFRKHIVPIDQVLLARGKKAAQQKDAPYVLPEMCKGSGGKHSEDIIEDTSISEDGESSVSSQKSQPRTTIKIKTSPDDVASTSRATVESEELTNLEKLERLENEIQRALSEDSKQPLPESQLSQNAKRIELLQKSKCLVDISGTGFTVMTVGKENSHQTLFGGVITCETCHAYVNDMTNTHSKQKVERNFAWGMFYKQEKHSLFVAGNNKNWYSLKHSMLEHLRCSDKRGGGTQHFLGLLHHLRQTLKRKASLKATANLIRCALMAVKMKGATTLYENQVYLLSAADAFIGQPGDDRNQFNDIIKAFYAYTKIRTKLLLSEIQPSTGLPRHFATTSDKCPHMGTTNQTVIILTVINGKKESIPLTEPSVYAANPDGEVSSSTAADLAKQIAKVLLEDTKLDSTILPRLMSHQAEGECVGSAGFLVEAITSEASRNDALPQNHDKFWAVDSAVTHWLDRCFVGLYDKSDNMLGTFMSRCARFSSMLDMGSCFVEYEGLASVVNVPAHVEVPALYTTRFTNGSFCQFEMIYENYEALAKTYIALYKTIDCEQTGYVIRGRDFVIDVCGILDCLTPVMDVMGRVQSVGNNVWDIVRLWPRLKQMLSDKIEQLTDVSEICPPNSNLFPKLSLHWEDLSKKNAKECLFKNVPLLEGWLVSNTHSRKAEVPRTERSPSDCIEDLRCLIEKLKCAIDSRFKSCVPAAAHDLAKCFDAWNIIDFFAGDSGDSKLSRSNMLRMKRIGLEEFETFFAYVCSLKHVKEYATQQPCLMLSREFSGEILFNFRKHVHSALFKDFANCRRKWFKNAQLPEGIKLKSIEICRGPAELEQRYILKFKSAEFTCQFDSQEFYKSFYENELFYTKIGKEFCIALDVALSMGASEAVVEGFYSVMKSQQPDEYQSNEMLSQRTIVDWLFPLPLHCPLDTITEVAKLYLDGNEEFGLSKHTLPISFDSEIITDSKGNKVLEKIRAINKSSFILCPEDRIS